jgi:hypothetical protein
VDLSNGVAARIAGLCLDSRGRLSERLLCGTAVRGALLLDLGLAARVESTDDSVVVDPTPTGFAPADRLLAAVAVEHERSLDSWLDEKRIGLRDVADAHVVSGRWSSRRGPFGLGLRYADLRPDETSRDLTRQPATDTAGWSPADACVTAIAGASGLLDRGESLLERPPGEVIVASGPVAWLCTAVVDHLLATGARYRSQAGALGAAGPF